jgi:hypothetical protein
LAALLLLLRLLLSGILRLLVRHTALQLNPSPKPDSSADGPAPGDFASSW